MPRPRKSQQSKEQLLKIGTEKISCKGYAGTGLQEILTEAGVPKGSFYNYFSSKENFVEAIIDNYMEQLFALIDSYMQRSDLRAIDQLTGVHNQLLAYIRFHDENTGCLLGALAAEVGSTAPELHKVMNNTASAWIDRYSMILQSGQAQGDVRTDIPADLLASVFWNAWQGALIKLQIDQSTDNLEAAFSIMLDLVKVNNIANNGSETENEK